MSILRQVLYFVYTKAHFHPLRAMRCKHGTAVGYQCFQCPYPWTALPADGRPATPLGHREVETYRASSISYGRSQSTPPHTVHMPPALPNVQRSAGQRIEVNIWL